MKKIVYLIDQPFDDWNRDRFGIRAWVDRGWTVEVWDLTPLVQPKVWARFLDACPRRRTEEHHPIASYRALGERLALLDGATHFIDLSGDTVHSARVKAGLVRRGVARVLFATGTIPEPSDTERITFAKRVRKAIERGPVQTLKWFDERIGGALVRRFAAPAVLVVSGEKSVPAAGSSLVLRAHNLDYDTFLRLRAAPLDATRHEAVFIDQDYCFHPDFVAMGSPFWTTPERYFPAVRKGLRAIARALGVGVRIAAHPRAAARGSAQQYFEEIPVDYGRTAEAIRDCAVVVCHDSTAVQYAVLFEKPAIFVTTDELDASFAGGSIARFAAELGKTVVNLDRDLTDVDWRRELTVDLERYRAYRHRYVKTDGSPEILSWHIVIDHIEVAAERHEAGRRPARALATRSR